MLYPDAEKRIYEINEMANLFKQKGYLQTSKEILNISDILKGDAIPQDFLKQLDDSAKNEATFIDEPANFKKTLTFEEFAQKALELEDSYQERVSVIWLGRSGIWMPSCGLLCQKQSLSLV